jgi:uncharacterized protein (TIGR02453 family)
VQADRGFESRPLRFKATRRPAACRRYDPLMWPPAALDFLRELEDNNDRDWFKANRARYDNDLLGPARDLASKLERLGPPHFFRPYNNTRFRPGPPLKEHIAVGIGDGPAVYYFQLSLDGLVLGAGLWHPESDQLERFRAAIDDGRRGGAFNRAAAKAETGGLSLVQPELKRAPKGYSPDHPRIDRLRLKRVAVSRRHPLRRWLHTHAADERIKSELEAARPFVTWLNDNVGPSTRPRPR